MPILTSTKAFIVLVLGVCKLGRSFDIPRRNCVLTPNHLLDQRQRHLLNCKRARRRVHVQRLEMRAEESNDDSESEDKLPEDLLSKLELGRPSELMILKELLGINIFTYIIAAAIAFFLGMNVIFGPGWLGNTIGLKGTGTFSEISDSLPDMIDLSSGDYLL